MLLSRRRVSLALLVTTVLSLAMLAFRVAGYPRMLPLPGAKWLLAEAVGLLVLSALCSLCFMRWAHNVPARLFSGVALIGVVAAAVQWFHVCIERFVDFSSWNGRITLVFMLSTFSLWAFAGFYARRHGQSLGRSIALAAWTATFTMTLAVCAGIALELYLAPTPLDSMRYWVEFTRTGWADLHAFAIANTLDSVVSHLLLAPIVGVIVGAFAALLAKPLPSSIPVPNR